MHGPPQTHTCHDAHGTIHIPVSNPTPFQNNAWYFGEGVQNLTHAVGWPVFQTKIKWLYAAQRRSCQVSVSLK